MARKPTDRRHRSVDLRSPRHRNGRTTIRMEAAFLDALEEIARREDLTVDEIARRVERHRPSDRDRTAALRSLAVHYFRAAAGPADAGAFDRAMETVFPDGA